MKHLLLLALALSATAHATDLGILKQGCAACHKPDQKFVGPAFRDVAARYRAAPGVEQMLAGRIRTGSLGTWGPVAMPPALNIPESEARKLALWVLRM